MPRKLRPAMPEMSRPITRPIATNPKSQYPTNLLHVDLLVRLTPQITLGFLACWIVVSSGDAQASIDVAQQGAGSHAQFGFCEVDRCPLRSIKHLAVVAAAPKPWTPPAPTPPLERQEDIPPSAALIAIPTATASAAVKKPRKKSRKKASPTRATCTPGIGKKPST